MARAFRPKSLEFHYCLATVLVYLPGRYIVLTVVNQVHSTYSFLKHSAWVRYSASQVTTFLYRGKGVCLGNLSYCPQLFTSSLYAMRA